MTISGGTMTTPMYECAATGTSVGTFYILDDSGQVWVVTNGGTTATLLTGNTTAGSGKGRGIAYWQNYLIVWGTTYIDVCGNGTGVGGITSGNWVSIAGSGHFLTNISARSITGGITQGDTSFNLTSAWDYSSGIYEVLINAGGQYVIGTFTNGQTLVTFTPPANATNASTTVDIHIFPQVAKPSAPYQHQAIIGLQDDVVYFCNGPAIGTIATTQDQFFNPQTFLTYEYNYAAQTLPITDVANWLTILSENLLIGGNIALYPWGAFANPQQVGLGTPVPAPENISKMINILNNIYIFAGNKGNIYQSNGYSLSIFKKIPDSFLGTIDPNWVIGGVMFHRNKLYFGAYGVSQDSSTKVVGVFSLVLIGGSTQYSLESSGALTFESQNSFGSVPTSSNDATNVLIDLNYPSITPAATQADLYISAWYNNTVGGVDYNDTTLWSNYEPSIQSDLIPCGTYLQATDFENVQFKLDRPMLNGDSIKLYYRTNFTDSYTLIGTSTATSTFLPLSDNFNSNVNNAQWIQLMATFACAGTSSFLPLREIRLYYANAAIS